MPRHPALSNYKPTPTLPNASPTPALPVGYKRYTNVMASRYAWSCLWTKDGNIPKCCLPIVDTALYDESGSDFSTTIDRWLFTNSKNEILKKTSVKTSLSAFVGRMIGLAHAGDFRAEDGQDQAVSKAKSICAVYFSSGDVVPMGVKEVSSLLAAQYTGGQHPFLNRTVAITANVRGAAKRARIRLQNAYRLVNGLGKPVTATYRLVPLGTLKDGGAATGNSPHVPSSPQETTLGRLLSREKLLNGRLDNLTDSLIKRIEHIKGVKVYAVMVDYLVEEPPSSSGSTKNKYKTTRPKKSVEEEEEDGWMWQGQPRIWMERCVDIEFVPLPHKKQACVFDGEGKKKTKHKRKKEEKLQDAEDESRSSEDEVGKSPKKIVRRGDAHEDNSRDQHWHRSNNSRGAPPLGELRSRSAPSNEKKSLLERAGLKTKKKYCVGDFCGYDSDEEKLVMNELNTGSGVNKGAAAAIRVAKKAARDARDGARRLREEKQSRERKNLAMLGLVIDKSGARGDPTGEESDEDSDLERELEARRSDAMKKVNNLQGPPKRNLAVYAMGYKSIAAAKEDQRSELTLEATWSPTLRHWWRRMGMGVRSQSRTKALLLLNPKRNCFFSAGERLPIRWACHGDIQRVNVELHRDSVKAGGGGRRRSLVISSHRPMACGMGISRGSMLWRIPKDFDRTGEEKRKWKRRTLAQRSSSGPEEHHDTFWDDEDEEDERRQEEESFHEMYGRWRIVVLAASGVEKGVVFAVSDMFYIAQKSHECKISARKSQHMQQVEGDETEELQVNGWAQQLSRRSNNAAHIDNMMGRVMGVSDEDDLIKPGAIGDFYKDVDICADCYKVYRLLDKRRAKMRLAAQQHNRIHPRGMQGGNGIDGTMGAGSEGALGAGKLHGRGLRQEEIWEALGYGRQKRRAEKDVVQKQTANVEKLSQVPKHRDLRKIRKDEDRRRREEERRKKRSMGVNEPQEERTDLDEEGNKLNGVSRVIKRIEKRTKTLAMVSEGAVASWWGGVVLGGQKTKPEQR